MILRPCTLTMPQSKNLEFPSPLSNAAVGGAGTVNVTATSAEVIYATNATSARFSHPVVVGQRYRVSWSESGTSGGQAGFGTSAGGTQYRSTFASGQGTFFDFTATTATLWISFQRASAGTTTFSNIRIEPISEPTWADMSPNPISDLTADWVLSAGVTVNESTGDLTIAATGSTISGRQEIDVVANKLYRLAWTNTSNTTMCLIGTTNGGSQIKTASSSDAVGARTFEFVGQGTTMWVQWQRATTGTAVVTNPRVQEAVGW